MMTTLPQRSEAMMTTSKRRKENRKPVSGTVRWLRPLIVGKQLGRLSIINARSARTYRAGQPLDGEARPQGILSIHREQQW